MEYSVNDVKSLYQAAGLLLRASTGQDVYALGVESVNFEAAKKLFEANVRNVANKLEAVV